MRHAPSTLHFSQVFRAAAPVGTIEWEELPSLAQRVRPLASAPAGTVWDATRPAELERPAPSQPFREPLKGVESPVNETGASPDESGETAEEKPGGEA